MVRALEVAVDHGELIQNGVPIKVGKSSDQEIGPRASSDDHVVSLHGDGIELLVVVGDKVKRLDAAGSKARVELAGGGESHHERLVIGAVVVLAGDHDSAVLIERPSPPKGTAGAEVVGKLAVSGKRRIQRPIRVEARDCDGIVVVEDLRFADRDDLAVSLNEQFSNIGITETEIDVGAAGTCKLLVVTSVRRQPPDAHVVTVPRLRCRPPNEGFVSAQRHGVADGVDRVREIDVTPAVVVERRIERRIRVESNHAHPVFPVVVRARADEHDLVVRGDGDRCGPHVRVWSVISDPMTAIG